MGMAAVIGRQKEGDVRRRHQAGIATCVAAAAWLSTSPHAVD
jgi:hypothetical protein